MTQEKRLGLSAVQKSDLWRRWKARPPLHEIGRAFGKEHSSIRCLVSRHGGIVPAVQRRSLRTLTLGERENRYTRPVSMVSTIANGIAAANTRIANVVRIVSRRRVTSPALRNATLCPRCGSYPPVLATRWRDPPE